MGACTRPAPPRPALLSARSLSPVRDSVHSRAIPSQAAGQYWPYQEGARHTQLLEGRHQAGIVLDLKPARRMGLQRVGLEAIAEQSSSTTQHTGLRWLID